METEGLKSDIQSTSGKLKEYTLMMLRLLRKFFAQYVFPPLIKTFKYVTSKVYRDRIAGKVRVRKDGNTKQTDRIKDLSYSESAEIASDYIKKGVPFYVQPENTRDTGIDTKKRMDSIKKFFKTKFELEKAKDKALEKPNNEKLQQKITDLQEQFDKEAKEMDEKGYKFTVVTNVSRKHENDLQRERIIQMRVAKGEKIIDDTLDVNKSETIKKETSEYDKMFIDEKKFNEMLEKATQIKGTDLTKDEINSVKGQCKYQQVTVDAFKETANAEKSGYTVYQYDKEQANAICKELNDNDDIEVFTCELSKDGDGNDVVDVYIYDKDNQNYEHKEGIPFQHISTLEKDAPINKAPSQEGEFTYNKLPLTVPVSNIETAKRIFKNKDYSIKYSIDKDGSKVGLITVNSLSLAEAKEMYQTEKSRNVVEEKLDELNAKDFKNIKSEAQLTNDKSVRSIIRNMKQKSESDVGYSKSRLELLNKYNDCCEAYGTKELNKEQYSNFINEYYGSYNNNIDKYLDNIRDNKTTEQNINNFENDLKNSNILNDTKTRGSVDVESTEDIDINFGE